MMKYCLSLIVVGVVLCCVGSNFILYDKYEKLLYRVQKLEAGPAKGLLLQPNERSDKRFSDEEINNLLKEMFEQMLRSKTV